MKKKSCFPQISQMIALKIYQSHTVISVHFCYIVITCSLPADVSETTHYENPRSIYYNEETLVEVCDNGYDERTHVCNGYTGSWYTSSSINCTIPNNPDNGGILNGPMHFWSRSFLSHFLSYGIEYLFIYLFTVFFIQGSLFST